MNIRRIHKHIWIGWLAKNVCDCNAPGKLQDAIFWLINTTANIVGSMLVVLHSGALGEETLPSSGHSVALPILFSATNC